LVCDLEFFASSFLDSEVACFQGTGVSVADQEDFDYDVCQGFSGCRSLPENCKEIFCQESGLL